MILAVLYRFRRSVLLDLLDIQIGLREVWDVGSLDNFLQRKFIAEEVKLSIEFQLEDVEHNFLMKLFVAEVL